MSVYFYGCITMDGYLADRSHKLDWLYETGTVEETGYQSFYDKMDITIMGKRTFEAIQHMENLDEVYPATQNYVFTHETHLLSAAFEPVQGDITEFVKQFGKDKQIWIVGGNTLLAPLLEQNMIDCMIIQVAPVLLGAGIPLFTQKEERKNFHLKEVKQYGPFAELVYTKEQ